MAEGDGQHGVTPMDDDRCDRVREDAVLLSRDVSERADVLGLGIEASLEPMVIARARRDATGCIRDFEYVELSDSACQFLGRSRHELLSTGIRGVWPPEVADELVDWLAQVVESQSSAVRHNVALVTTRIQTTGRFSI